VPRDSEDDRSVAIQGRCLPLRFHMVSP
jgi:hypothetical protein